MVTEIRAVEDVQEARRVEALELQDRYREIVEFAQRTEERQSIIQELLRENFGAPKRLQRRVNDVRQYAEQYFAMEQLKALHDALALVRGRVTSEIAAFLQLSLENTLLVDVAG